MKSDKFEIRAITLHGKVKYEIVFAEGGKHLCYLSDRGEALNVLKHLNK